LTPVFNVFSLVRVRRCLAKACLAKVCLQATSKGKNAFASPSIMFGDPNFASTNPVILGSERLTGGLNLEVNDIDFFV